VICASASENLALAGAKKVEIAARYWGMMLIPTNEMWEHWILVGDLNTGALFQLRELRGAGGQGPPAARDPRDRLCRVDGAVAEFTKLYARLGRPGLPTPIRSVQTGRLRSRLKSAVLYH
jgi:hypothetical protein